MKKYTYTVAGIETEARGEALLTLISRVVPEIVDPELDFENSTVSFSIDPKAVDISLAEKTLAEALAEFNFELVLPADVQNFSYVGDNPKKTKMIPLSVAVAVIAAAMVITMLFTFVIAQMLPSSGWGSVNFPSGGSANITLDADDLPEYLQNLIKLDEIFKTYSYDGIDESKMGDAILKAYIEATGDVYAEYMNKEEYEAYQSESLGDFVGVGVSIVNSTIEINGYNYKVLQIISVLDNSPALANGVMVGDCIVYVGGGDDKVLVDDIGHSEALNSMLGEAGTEAKFTVFRPDATEDNGYRSIDFSIVRAKVVTQSVKYRISETDSRVGIINVTGFDATTAPQFSKAVDKLRADGCEYFVFDMRNNPGGALAAIEAVLSYFLDQGDLIVSTEYADGTIREDRVQPVNYSYYYGDEYEGYNIYKSDIGKYKSLIGKCVVLTNENTASAAELFTATFRDYGIASIVGETTYGKGCMQDIVDLKKKFNLDLGALRVTVALYFSKSHHDYHGIGIVPDYEVELSEEALKYNFYLLPEDKDNQLQKAIEVLFK